jgi:heat shock protein HslJ
MKKLLIAISVFAVLFSSCKKDDPPAATCSGTTVANVAGTYKITALRYKVTSSAPEQDYYNILPDCEKDNLTILAANGSLTYQDAGTACSPSNAYVGDWTLSGNTITLETYSGTVQSFDCKTLVVVATNYYNPGDRITFTYTKQ